MKRLYRYGRAVFGLLLSALCLSCGGGGSSDPSGTTWTVTPDSIAGVSSIVLYKNLSQSSADVLAVDVAVHSVMAASVYGAALDLGFDSSVIVWNGSGVSSCTGSAAGCMTGNFLEQTSLNGVLYDVTLQQGTTNKLIIGVAQTGNDPGATGSGTLVTLFFNRVAAGTTPLEFSDNALRNPPPSSSDISGINWFGATVTAQ